MALAVCLLAAGCGGAWPKPLVGNGSAVVVLLDYSKSFAPYTASDTAALTEVSRAIVQMTRSAALAQPVKVLWTAFGDNGLRPLEPCGPPRIFSQRLTGSPSPARDGDPLAPGEPITRIDGLESWLAVCVSAIRATSQSTQRFTDISGALMFGAEAVEDIREARLIVLFTDLLEDQPPNRKPPTVRLDGSRVLLVWRPGLDDERQPTDVTRRVDEWRTKLTAAGASRVCTKAAQGLTEGEVSTCLWK
jgi:hypothetical protein